LLHTLDKCLIQFVFAHPGRLLTSFGASRGRS
jgi:hypothetical protein